MRRLILLTVQGAALQPRAAVFVLLVFIGALPMTGAAGASSSVAAENTLPCQDVIAWPDLKDLTDYSKVLGRVALPTKSALGAVRQSDSAEAATAYWSKQGLVIKWGARVAMTVPRAWRGRMAIGWGSPAAPTEHLLIAGCKAGQDPGAWLAFAGGFWVSEPACVPLIVDVGQRRQRVHIGVGAACPGQNPPPVYR
jgi:hypothetical protein